MPNRTLRKKFFFFAKRSRYRKGSGNVSLQTPFNNVGHEWYEPQDPESKVELLFIYKEDHTLLTITQSQIPDEMSEKIKELWKIKYFKSLKNRFNTV